MDKNTANLTNRQLLAISHLISSSSIEEACRKAKVSKGTIYAWLKDEVFKAELKRQRDAVVEEALNQLKGATGKAVRELIKLISSARPTIRRWACRDVIDYTLKSIELESVEERLDKIEEAVFEKMSKR